MMMIRAVDVFVSMSDKSELYTIDIFDFIAENTLAVGTALFSFLTFSSAPP